MSLKDKEEKETYATWVRLTFNQNKSSFVRVNHNTLAIFQLMIYSDMPNNFKPTITKQMSFFHI